jgi:hypothetical protein
MENKKQSSVEWLEKQFYIRLSEKSLKSVFAKAKEMRMQELKHAYEAEQNNCRGIFKYENFEHYYQETFNSQENGKV